MKLAEFRQLSLIYGLNYAYLKILPFMLSGHDFLFLQTAALKMLCIYFFQNIVTTYEYF